MKPYEQVRGAVATYDLSFLKAPYCEEYPNYAFGFSLYCHELRKFLALPLKSKGPLAAMSHGVDKLWHTFIVHTPQYHQFCDEMYGEYLHHQPRSVRFPVPVEAISNFYTDYSANFGSVPKVWFEDIPESLVAAVVHGEVPEALSRLKWSGWPGR